MDVQAVQADPWGAAMLGAAALSGIALLFVVVRQFSGGNTRSGGWVLGLGLLAFLASAGLGTFARLEASEPPKTAARGAMPHAADAPPNANEPDTPARANLKPTADAPTADAPTADAPSEGEPTADAPTADTSKEDDLPKEHPIPEARPTATVANTKIGSALEPVEALPSDPDARKAAIRKVLRDAKIVYEDEQDCKSAAELGQAWAAVSALPSDAPQSRVEVVVRRLEECRRIARWATAYTVHRKRVSARDELKSTLAKRFSDDHKLTAVIKLSGKDHERIRVGSGRLDDTIVATVMTKAMKQELTDLGFELVVLSSGKQTWKTELEPRPESDYITDAMRPYGLHDKLAWPADE